MSDSQPAVSDPTAEFARELAKQLPIKNIYNDAASPAARQTGQLAQDLVKTIQLALAPVQLLGALQDRYRDFLDRSVRKVPPERRLAPPPQIVGPVLESIRFEPDGTPISEMFSELLSASMDSERVGSAHPAFPLLVKQLSCDEAKILESLAAGPYDFVYTSEYDSNRNLFGTRQVEIDRLPRDGLLFAENVPFYFEHLDKLGLAGIFQEGNQEPLWRSTSPQEPKRQTGVRVRCNYRLTDFGRVFVRACIGR